MLLFLPCKKKNCFESRKRTQKQAQKDMNKIERLKIDYLIFLAMRMRKLYLFCTSGHHNGPYEKQQDFDKGSKSPIECVCNGAWTIVKYAPQ